MSGRKDWSLVKPPVTLETGIVTSADGGMQSSEQMVQPMGPGRIGGRCRYPGYKGTGKEIA